MLLHKIQTTDIQDFLNFLLKEGNITKLKNTTKKGNGLSNWVVKKIRSLLIAAFEAAIREKLIISNPAKDTEPITVNTLQVAFFTPLQQQLFLTKTKNRRFYAAYELLFYSGLRRSELLGLARDCVDFEQNIIHIRRVLVMVNGKPYLKEYPKTKRSVRTIPIHPEVMAKLEDHLKRQDIEAATYPGWSNPYNLLFTNKDGSPHSPAYFHHNFKNALKKLGLPKNLRVHSTRHTFVTKLLQLKTSIADIQALGGWSDTRVVLGVYAHTVQDSHRHAMQELYEHGQVNTKKRRRKKGV